MSHNFICVEIAPHFRWPPNEEKMQLVREKYDVIDELILFCFKHKYNIQTNSSCAIPAQNRPKKTRSIKARCGIFLSCKVVWAVWGWQNSTKTRSLPWHLFRLFQNRKRKILLSRKDKTPIHTKLWYCLKSPLFWLFQRLCGGDLVAFKNENFPTQKWR